MDINQQTINNVTVLSPKGRVDTVSANDLEAKLNELIDESQLQIVLDFSGVDLISSAGLRVLLMIAKKLKPRSGELMLCGMDENVFEVFDISGFASMFSIHEDIDKAVAAFG